ncbi:helicase-related protein [Parvibaculum sp.]|uniref:helicase-related protein n=1 Tax=Parvibaculum sp. TaxID=2024848 RepID=UPI003919909A
MSIPPLQTPDGKARDGIAERRRITAVLGPTNTGKTHLAIERMMGHESGMIGLPLRLLAREVYDRVVKVKGPRAVALITGEEKILPQSARYFICTVEAMPLEREVEFLAVDEIQLAADRERGHTFTDRLLRSRGRSETMMLGSETARSLIQKLLPDTRFVNRPRFSELSWTGPKKITRLPRRTAIVAFSADQVYAIAELIRRQRGGAAVVMGALSPRTRNAQVALYQSGEVDFLVATDAIGMGLNMDVDHVAFASTQKFDGHQHRPLGVAELAQIAGRAGRYMNNGTFGTTGDAANLPDDIIARIENHQFEPERVFQWRNPHLDFANIPALIQSLEAPPARAGLMRAQTADDLEALERMSRTPEVAALARSPHAIRRLWEVAQVPDFRKTLASEHASLLTRLYLFLMDKAGDTPERIPEDWLERQIGKLDRADGDIDILATRLAHMRTWSYVANRADWLHNPAHWQERARKIEDRLSDALHERLTQRFVDRRTSVLMKRLRQNEELMAAVNGDGEVLVEGEYAGHLEGFVFVPDPRADGEQARVLRAAADQALASEIAARAQRLVTAPDADIALSEHGRVVWAGHPVAELKGSDNILLPRVELVTGEQLNGPAREAVQARLDAWLKMHVTQVLAPLVALRDATDIEGLARGIAFQLVENLGALGRETVAEDVRTLDQAARGQLRKHGVRFGAYSIFVPALLKPAPARLKLILWALSRKDVEDPFAALPALPAPGLTSVPAEANVPEGFYGALGFRVCGTRAVRLDMLERVADLIRPVIASRAYNGGFIVTPDMMSLVGCSGEEFAGLLRGLGYRSQVEKLVPPKPAAAVPAENAPVMKVTEVADATTAPAEDPAPETADVPESQEVASEPEASVETVTEPVVEPAPAEAATAGAETAPAEPVEMEIWRPSRRRHGGETNRKPRRERNRPQGHGQVQGQAQAGERRDGEPQKDGGKPDARKRDDGNKEARHRQGGKPRRDGKHEKPRDYSFSKPKPRDREPDPDSPFAALAVLKERNRTS